MNQQKKSYFRELEVKDIRKLIVSQTSNNNTLVQSIHDLDPYQDALEIRVQIIPGKYKKGNLAGFEASRKCYKHGTLIALPQPATLKEAYETWEIPLDLRAQAFYELTKMNQREINYVGFSWRPVLGRNRTKRIVPFVNCPKGIKLFSYAENFSTYRIRNQETGQIEEKKGIKVKPYSDVKRVKVEGAEVIVDVPSQTEKKRKYKFGLVHVPYIPNSPEEETNLNLGVILSLEPKLLVDEISGEPFDGRTPHSIHDIQYKFIEQREQSNVIRFTPQDIAGYLGIIKVQLGEQHNLTALSYNPFALPSKLQAKFYNKLCNNVIIFDPSLTSKHKLRKPHLAEKSILLARAIGHFGHDEFAYWDPTRDGLFKDYNWQPTNSNEHVSS